MEQYTNEQVQEYIKSKSNAWSPTTIRSEHARLRATLPLINLGPEELFARGSVQYAPYALKTLFIRAGELAGFVTPSLTNPFKEFVRKNARLFKNSYTREVLTVSFNDAVSRIETIESKQIRDLVTFILFSGMRAEEAISYDPSSGVIFGKGARKRRLIMLLGVVYPVNHGITYSMLHKALTKVGLKPHTLRKLYTTKLVEGNVREADLMRIMGWSSIQTASIYVQPKRDEALQKQLEGIFKRGKEE